MKRKTTLSPLIVVGLLAAGFISYACSAAGASAVEAVAESGPGAAPTLSAPVIGAMSVQLGSLSRLQSFDPSILALKLSHLAVGADPNAAGGIRMSDAASAVIIKRALSDPASYGLIEKSLSLSRDPRAAQAAQTLAALRTGMPDGVGAAAVFDKAMGRFEKDFLSGSKIRSLDDLGSALDELYTGTAQGATASDLAVRPAAVEGSIADGRSNKIMRPLSPAGQGGDGLRAGGTVVDKRGNVGTVDEFRPNGEAAVRMQDGVHYYKVNDLSRSVGDFAGVEIGDEVRDQRGNAGAVELLFADGRAKVRLRDGGGVYRVEDLTVPLRLGDKVIDTSRDGEVGIVRDFHADGSALVQMGESLYDYPAKDLSRSVRRLAGIAVGDGIVDKHGHFGTVELIFANGDAKVRMNGDIRDYRVKDLTPRDFGGIRKPLMTGTVERLSAAGILMALASTTPAVLFFLLQVAGGVFIAYLGFKTVKARTDRMSAAFAAISGLTGYLVMAFGVAFALGTVAVTLGWMPPSALEVGHFFR
jgi:hypothetical protein